jgi:hypothetical protein
MIMLLMHASARKSCDYVAFVYASHDLHALKRQDDTCSLWYGGINGAAEIVIREGAKRSFLPSRASYCGKDD